MAINLERFRKDLKQLIRLGDELELSMILDMMGRENFRKKVLREYSEEDSEKSINNLPNFKSKYEEWYSESMSLIRQILPNRLANFQAYYEKPRNRKSVEYGNYVLQDFMQGLTVSRPTGDVIVDPSAALPQFKQQLAILKAAERRFESALFEIRQLVQADLFDTEIDAARELLKNKFFRAAGAVTGVVLEKHLKQVCDDHGVKIRKAKPSIADLSQALRDANVIDLPQWRFNQHLADIRNLCDHHKAQDPTKEQVGDLIDGTAKVLKTIA